MYDYYSSTYRSERPGALEIAMRARREQRPYAAYRSEVSLLGLMLAAFGLPTWRKG